jgi:hypothetical protein
MDLIGDIAGMYFPLRTMQYAKNMNVSDELGTGSHDPYALTNQEHLMLDPSPMHPTW